MTVTIYTLHDCPFCQSAKEYFQTNNIPFVEKNVENDPKALEEMQQLSNKFPGVPYTHVTKDDGTVEGLKGFTKEDFDRVLLGTSMAQQAAPADVTVPAADTSTPVAPAVEAPAPDMSVAAPVIETPAVTNPLYQPEPVAQPVSPEPVPAVPSAPVADEAMSTAGATDANTNKDLEDTLQKLQDQLKTPSASSGQAASERVSPVQVDMTPAVDMSVMPAPEVVTPATDVAVTPTAPVVETPPAIPDFPSASSGQAPSAGSASSTGSGQVGSQQASSGQVPQDQNSDAKPL